MRPRTLLRTLAVPTSVVALVLTVAAAPVAAHRQIVTPPGQESPVVSGPISKPWAQAHCNANSPSIIEERSNGVVQFLPKSGTDLCPAVPNPGDQIHGD